MKTRFWIALPLAATLIVPALAQQTSPTQNQQPTTQEEPAQPQAQPPAQTQTQTPEQKTGESATGKQPLTIERHEGFWGKINPFARKKYVARQLEPVKDRVNELDQLTAANSKMIKDVDARAQQGIQMAHNKANEADMHAVDAGNRAQQAQQTATQATTRVQTVEQVVNNIDQYKPVTQTEIRFRPGQTVLSKKAKDALDDMSKNLKDQKGYIIEIQGFSAGRGEAAIETSQRMADAVRRYLVISNEVPVYRVHVLGLGSARLQNASGEQAPRVRGARVEVSLLKNDLEQLSAPQNNAAPSASATQGGVSGAATTEPSTTPTPQPGSTQPAGNMNTSPSTMPPNAVLPVPPKQQPPAPREQPQKAIPPTQ